ncbi:pentapeptide repeat-containing protein [Streptomyces sp. NPDC048650]|uniref:pentapeptide repeat-containing protein n=1 Tax=Streptomyces sp. NPDC048650 TaxID=3365583 RepID=UPI003723CD47
MRSPWARGPGGTPDRTVRPGRPPSPGAVRARRLRVQRVHRAAAGVGADDQDQVVAAVVDHREVAHIHLASAAVLPGERALGHRRLPDVDPPQTGRRGPAGAAVRGQLALLVLLIGHRVRAEVGGGVAAGHDQELVVAVDVTDLAAVVSAAPLPALVDGDLEALGVAQEPEALGEVRGLGGLRRLAAALFPALPRTAVPALGGGRTAAGCRARHARALGAARPGLGTGLRHEHHGVDDRAHEQQQHQSQQQPAQMPRAAPARCPLGVPVAGRPRCRVETDLDEQLLFVVRLLGGRRAGTGGGPGGPGRLGGTGLMEWLRLLRRAGRAGHGDHRRRRRGGGRRGGRGRHRARLPPPTRPLLLVPPLADQLTAAPHDRQPTAVGALPQRRDRHQPAADVRFRRRADQLAQPAAHLLGVRPPGGVPAEQRGDEAAQLLAALPGLGGRLRADQLRQLGGILLGKRGVALDGTEEQRADRPEIRGGTRHGGRPTALLRRFGLLRSPAFGDRADGLEARLPRPLRGQPGGRASVRGRVRGLDEQDLAVLRSRLAPWRGQFPRVEVIAVRVERRPGDGFVSAPGGSGRLAAGGRRRVLRRAVLRRAVLRRAVLRRAVLRRAVLRRAVLRRAVLRRRLPRRRFVAAQRLLRRADRQAAQDRPAVVADQDRAGGDVAVQPAVRMEGAQGGEDVGGDLRGAVRVERLLGEERGQRTGGDELAGDPQAAVLGEGVEDLVQQRVVGHLRGRRDGVQGAAYGRIARAAVGRPRARGPGRGTGEAGVTDDLRLDDLRQRHLTEQHLLPAVGVERAGLGEVLVARGPQRQAVSLGEHPSRVLVHDASPTALSRTAFTRTDCSLSRYVPGPTPDRAASVVHRTGRSARRPRNRPRNRRPGSARVSPSPRKCGTPSRAAAGTPRPTRRRPCT